MSNSILLIPVTRELLDWAQECEVPVSLDIPDGRMPSDVEVKGVVESFEGYTVTFGGSEEHPDIQVNSVEMVEWYYEDPNPVMNQTFGGPRRSPKQWVTICPIQPLKSKTGSLSFDGHNELIFRIAQELADRCGPLAIFDSGDGIPVFFLPEGHSPIWKEPWF